MTISDERRLVTVLFADMVGFTGRAEESDPEAVRDLQQRYFAAVSAEVERFGGSVEKFIGDAVMAIFGAPQAHDDDAERALRAALSMRAAVNGLESGLQLRIGVNSGEVVGGMGTGPQAGDYTVSGDAVNVAARLQQSAQPNEILAGATTRTLGAEAFAFAPLGEISVKGRAETLEAWRLERELPDRPRLRGGEARLVGRDREVALVESAIEEAASGRGLMLALVGEAGIGKTRLALEMRERAERRGFTSAWAVSRSYSSAFPYHLLRQLVRLLLAHEPGVSTADALRQRGLADDTPLERWAAIIDDMLGDEADAAIVAEISPAGRQRLLVHAITALLRAISRRQPLLVVLDDLHWADPASLAIVEELLDIVAETSVVLLAMYRPGWSHGWEGKSAYQQLNLRALPMDEARQLATELIRGSGVTAELAERVLERSAGNPFFLEEMLRRASADGDDQKRLPETIHEMLLARLDAQPAEARQTLQLASVVGTEFSERIVAALRDEDPGDTAEALRALQRAELIVRRPQGDGETTLAFRHPLIHEVAYRSLLLSTRRALHGRIGRWLEAHGGEELLSALALHYRDSDDREKARHYLPLAAARAESLNANLEAEGWFLDAAEAFAEDRGRRGEMVEAAARQRYLMGEIPLATERQNEAIALYESAGAEVAALNARRWLSRYLWLLGKPDEATRQSDLAIAGLERLPPSGALAFAYSFRAQILMLMPDFEAGAEWARKAIAVAEQTDASGALSHAYNNLGLCLVNLGDLSGLEYQRRSLALAIEHNLPDDAGRAYANMIGQGNRIFPFGHDELERVIGEAIEYGQRTIPDGVFDLWLRSAYGEFLLTVGRWTEAEAVLAAIDRSRAGLYLNCEVAALSAQLAVYRGRFDEALETLLGTREAVLGIGDVQAVLPGMAMLAAAHAGLGNLEEAVADLRTGVERRGRLREGWISTWYLFEAVDLLSAARAAGSADSAAWEAGLELMSRFADTIREDAHLAADPAAAAVRDAIFDASVEQLAWLAAGSGSMPTEARTRAATAVSAEQRAFDGARIRLWLAEAAGDRGLLGNAVSVFDELGAHPYLARASALGA